MKLIDKIKKHEEDRIEIFAELKVIMGKDGAEGELDLSLEEKWGIDGDTLFYDIKGDIDDGGHCEFEICSVGMQRKDFYVAEDNGYTYVCVYGLDDWENITTYILDNKNKQKITWE